MFLATPVMRAVARMLQPSTRAETTAARSELLRAFAILNIMRERTGKVKGLFGKTVGPFKEVDA